MATPILVGMFGLGPTELLIVALMLALSAFWIWMLVDCAIRISGGLHPAVNRFPWSAADQF
jgi:hypothetical protein